MGRLNELADTSAWTTSRDHADLLEMRGRFYAPPDIAVGSRIRQRATDVLELLAEAGPLHHRRVALPDLLIAAAAELAELPVLHYDRDFELIAEVTGQPMRPLAPLGSL